MKRKLVPAICAAAAMMLLICVTIFGEAPSITRDNLNNTTDMETMEKIAGIMLSDAERTGDITPEEIVKLDVLYGDFKGKGQKDAVLIADFGPRYTLLSAYEQDGDKYKFIDEVGVFTNTQDPRVVYLQNKNRDTVFINEILNEKIGAFERLEYDKGYIWDDKSQSFVNIYNYPVKIQADWNTNWDTGETQMPKGWQRVTQSTKSLLENGANPVIKSTYTQQYLVSDEQNALNIPLDNTYSLENSRVIEQNFYWSDEWNSFIIGEKIEKATGQKVAELILWSDLPYSLAEYNQNEEENTPGYNSLVRIKRKDGTTAVVNKDSLTDIKSNTTATRSYA